MAQLQRQLKGGSSALESQPFDNFQIAREQNAISVNIVIEYLLRLSDTSVISRSHLRCLCTLSLHQIVVLLDKSVH